MRFLPLLGAMALSGCVALIAQLDQKAKADIDATCEVRKTGCRFVNNPVVVDRDRARRIPTRQALFYPTVRQLDFVDGSGRIWVAHPGIVTDGATIPPIFVSIVGQPTSPEFVDAAAVHDAYAGVGNEGTPNYHNATWQDVHLMFYDALRVGGVPEIKAKIMFAAVWLGGPRWGEVQFNPKAQPAPAMRAAMRRTLGFIQSNNPSIPVLVRYLSSQEQAVAGAAAQVAGDRGGGDDGTGGPGNY